jgi:hypothetical protein
MLSFKQLVANRANAQHSTGPKWAMRPELSVNPTPLQWINPDSASSHHRQAAKWQAA